MARKGASKLAPRDEADHRPRPAYRSKDRAAPPGSAAEVWERSRQGDDGRPDDDRRLAERESDQWVLEGISREAGDAVRRGAAGRQGGDRAGATRAKRDKDRPDGGAGPKAAPARRRGTDPAQVAAFARAVGPERAERLERRLQDAARAVRRERFAEARQILRPLAKEAPGVAEVRELLGVCAYREGRWREAVKELEAFRELTGSTEQHPVLADSYRALGRFSEVSALWDELREASPGADLVAEGRIVAAGALADQGRLDDAIRLLEGGRKKVKRPKDRHLRMAYAVADLHERAGDVPRAREQFSWIRSQDPDFADVGDRLAGLG